MVGLDEQIELLKLVGRMLEKRTECYIIGGSAMLFYGLKSATKDIDIVFVSEEERNAVAQALGKAGFGKKDIEIFRHEEASRERPIIMERKDVRFDLFLNEIISTRLSPGIASRIKEKHEFSNLVAGIVSPEDIIFLKCATDREGDRKDAADIINSREISWDIIADEALWQSNHGRKLFTVYLFDFVMELKEKYKVPIPMEAVKKIMKQYEEGMEKYLMSRGARDSSK